MTAPARARFAELFAAHRIDLDGDDRPSPAPTERQLRKERVAAYAARIGSGLDLYDARPLAAGERASLRGTDYDPDGRPRTPAAVREAGRKRPGRPPKDDGRKPLAEAMNRDRRLAFERAARRYRGGPIPVPAWVGEHRAGEYRRMLRRAARPAAAGR